MLKDEGNPIFLKDMLPLYIYIYTHKVVQLRPGLIVCKQVTVCPGHILTTLYIYICMYVLKYMYGKAV